MQTQNLPPAAMKSLLILAIVFATTLYPSAYGTTVGFSPFSGPRTVRDASNTALADTNSLVWAGTFSSESFTLNNALSLGANVSAVKTAGGWNQFSLDTVTNTVNSGVTSTLGLNAAG